MKLSEAIAEARTFADTWTFCEITEVKVFQRTGDKEGGGGWVSLGPNKARIELCFTADFEAVYHEIFHSVFHPSPLHAGSDKNWGEAWCDAYRYFHDPAFTDKIDRHFLRRSYDEVKKNSGDWNHDKKYAYPCSLIIAQCGDYAGFRRLWRELCQKREVSKKDVLTSYFSYDPQSGITTTSP
jgi:hypothetical protein